MRSRIHRDRAIIRTLRGNEAQHTVLGFPVSTRRPVFRTHVVNNLVCVLFCVSLVTRHGMQVHLCAVFPFHNEVIGADCVDIPSALFAFLVRVHVLPLEQVDRLASFSYMCVIARSRAGYTTAMPDISIKVCCFLTALHTHTIRHLVCVWRSLYLCCFHGSSPLLLCGCLERVLQMSGTKKCYACFFA